MYDKEDLGYMGRFDILLQNSKKRSRSTDVKLPKVTEAKEENYAELKKKIIFQHKLKTLVDKTEPHLNKETSYSKAYSREESSNFRVIVEDPEEGEDAENRNLKNVFSTSITSSRTSSYLNSPRNRSLNKLRVDELCFSDRGGL